jgi:hypothetical protein
MNPEALLQKIEAVSQGTPELDRDFAAVFPSAPSNVTRSITIDRERASRLVVDVRVLHTQ